MFDLRVAIYARLRFGLRQSSGAFSFTRVAIRKAPEDWRSPKRKRA
jgi:hypothetical protein